MSALYAIEVKRYTRKCFARSASTPNHNVFVTEDEQQLGATEFAAHLAAKFKLVTPPTNHTVLSWVPQRKKKRYGQSTSKAKGKGGASPIAVATVAEALANLPALFARVAALEEQVAKLYRDLAPILPQD